MTRVNGQPSTSQLTGIWDSSGVVVNPLANDTIVSTGAIKVLVGAISFIGSLSTVRIMLKSLEGVLSFGGVLVAQLISGAAVAAVKDYANEWVRRARTFLMR